MHSQAQHIHGAAHQCEWLNWPNGLELLIRVTDQMDLNSYQSNWPNGLELLSVSLDKWAWTPISVTGQMGLNAYQCDWPNGLELLSLIVTWADNRIRRWSIGRQAKVMQTISSKQCFWLTVSIVFLDHGNYSNPSSRPVSTAIFNSRCWFLYKICLMTFKAHEFGKPTYLVHLLNLLSTQSNMVLWNGDDPFHLYEPRVILLLST